MRILIVSPNVSSKMGGEAILPFHYMREFVALGHDVVVLTHERVREELMASSLWRDGAFEFLEDAVLEKSLYGAGKLAPSALRSTVFNSAIGAVTLARLGARARSLCAERKIDVVLQPTPVSPQFPSPLHNLPAPVVIGPLNGGMSYPPAFEAAYSKGSQAAVNMARMASGVGNAMWPGKKRAARVLVANERTRRALPKGVDPARVEILVENGVDLALWKDGGGNTSAPPAYVFVGRMVWWKAADLLIEAFGRLKTPSRLLMIGDGPERARLERLAAASPQAAAIEFLGFRPQTEISEILGSATALVLPSMRECGGAVVLEAFACGTPAIATDWGGPQDYIRPETGFLISPASREKFLKDFAAAMERLAQDRDLRNRMGAAARQEVERCYSWSAKARRMEEILVGVVR